MDETSLSNMVHLKNISSSSSSSSPSTTSKKWSISSATNSLFRRTTKTAAATKSKPGIVSRPEYNSNNNNSNNNNNSTPPTTPSSSPKHIKKTFAVPPTRSSILRGQSSNVSETSCSDGNNNVKKLNIAHLSMGHDRSALSMAFMCGRRQFDADPSSCCQGLDGPSSKRKQQSKYEAVPKQQDDDEEEEQDEELIGRALYEKAAAQSILGNSDAALDFLNEALNLQRTKFGEENQNVARTLVSRGVVLASSGKIYDSVLDIEKAARIQKRVSTGSKTDKIEEACTLLKVGILQQERGNFVEAMDNFESALTIRKNVLGPSDEGVAEVLCIIGRAYHQRRRYVDAIHYFSEGILIYKAAASGVVVDLKKRPDVVWVLRCMMDKTLLAVCTADYWDDSNGV